MTPVGDDPRLVDVLNVLRTAHPAFPPVTIGRLVARVAASVEFLSGTDLHAAVVQEEAERQLAYVD